MQLDLDFDKPIRTRGFRAVQIFEIYEQPILAGNRHVIGMYQLDNKKWKVASWHLDGRYSARGDRKGELDLVNVVDLNNHRGLEEKLPRLAHNQQTREHRPASATTLDMLRKILLGEAVDLSDAPRENGFYVVDNFKEDLDYCVMETEQWIGSVGRRKSDGAIHASVRFDINENRAYKCVWIR